MLEKESLGHIYSLEEDSFLLLFYANKDPFCSPLYCNRTAFLNISYSRDLENTKKNLKKYNIRYIYLYDKSLWEKEDDGLLFLLRNNNTFKRINKGLIEIYSVNASSE